MYNNWSFSTASDVPLFLVVMAALVATLDEYGDLMLWRRPWPCMSNYLARI